MAAARKLAEYQFQLRPHFVDDAIEVLERGALNLLGNLDAIDAGAQECSQPTLETVLAVCETHMQLNPGEGHFATVAAQAKRLHSRRGADVKHVDVVRA